MRVTEVEALSVFAPGASPAFIRRDGLLGSPPDREAGVIRLRTDQGVEGVAIAPRRGAGPTVVDSSRFASVVGAVRVTPFGHGVLYAHMNVAENMGFALKIAKLKKSEIKARVLFDCESGARITGT